MLTRAAILLSLGSHLLLLGAEPTEWRCFGGDAGGVRFSPLTQITPRNVAQLSRAWVYHTGEIAAGTASRNAGKIEPFETTPLVIGGVMYITTASSRVIALDPETGKEIWRFDPPIEPSRKRAAPNRGISYWESGNAKRILYGTGSGHLVAFDARTGKLAPGFGREGMVDLRENFAEKWPPSAYAVTSPPVVYRDLVITGSRVPEGPGRGPSGAVRAFDIRTGKQAWVFHTVPQPGEPGHETWEGDSWKDRTGVNVWSIMSIDAERGIVFLPVGSPAYDFYGGDRKGQNLYGNCLVALNASTGKLLWYYQLVHHDVWDYDPPAQPTLVTVRRGGREIPAVAQVTKMGLVFVFDRVTGKPLLPIEERAAPMSDVPGEATWPTQPFPLAPPPISRIAIERRELSKVTPESQRYCEELFDSTITRGMFTPYGLKLTLVLPGTLGGATWSGGAFDSRTGYYFVNGNEQGAVGMMAEQPAGSPDRYRRTSKWGSYARFTDPNGWPCVAPPWGTLNA
ncbi:MAG: PQQ-binding-like beta-propeller repeat protein, partial [Bryobacteraceae bacterium]